MGIKTNEKIRVRLESFNHELLTASCRKIVESYTKYEFNLISSGSFTYR